MSSPVEDAATRILAAALAAEASAQQALEQLIELSKEIAAILHRAGEDHHV